MRNPTGLFAWWQWLLILQAVVVWFAIDFCIKWVQIDRTDYAKLSKQVSEQISAAIESAIAPIKESHEEVRTYLIKCQRLEAIQKALSEKQFDPIEQPQGMLADQSIYDTGNWDRKNFIREFHWLYPDPQKIDEGLNQALRSAGIVPEVTPQTIEEKFKRLMIRRATMKGWLVNEEEMLVRSIRLRDVSV